VPESETGIVKNDVVNADKNNIIYDINDVNLRANTQDIQQLMQNPIDKDDEKMNSFFYELAISVSDLIMNPEFNKYAINLAKKRDDNSANLIILMKNNPKFADIINNRLSSKGLSFNDICNNFTHNNGKNIEKYIPVIFIPNLKTLNVKKQPILSPNIELNCDKNSDLENSIIAWYYSKEGEKKEIIINEEDAEKTTNPIFIIANAEENFKKNTGLIQDDIISDDTKSKTVSFQTHEYMIKYRYERSGNSEFAISAVRINSTGSVSNVLRKDNGDYVSTKDISSVDKNDMGKDLAHWEQFCNNYSPYSDNFIFYNTYERDWNNTDKSLGHAVTQNGGSAYLYGKRRYSSEWYAWDPNTLSNHEVNIQYVYDHWAIWYTSSKTKLRFWKIQ